MTAVQPISSLKDSLAAQLLTTVFALYCLVTFSVTLVHMIAEYLNTQDGVVQELAVFHHTFEPGLAQALWEYNEPQLKSTLAGMVDVPIIRGVKLLNPSHDQVLGQLGLMLDTTGHPIRVDAKGHALPLENAWTKVIGRTFPIVYRGPGEERTMAELTLYFSTDVVVEKVRYGFGFILFNSLIKTMALWAIFLWVAKRKLSRPLQILTQAASQVHLDRLEQQLDLDVKIQGRNELKILEGAFNRMTRLLLTGRERMVALRVFSNNIRSFQDAGAIVQSAFTELCAQTRHSSAALYLSLPGSQNSPQLVSHGGDVRWQVWPTRGSLKAIWQGDTQEIHLRNSPLTEQGSLVPRAVALSGSAPPIWPLASHVLGIRGSKPLEFAILLVREPDQAGFDRDDQEFARGMLEEARTVWWNLESLKEKNRLESELATTAAVQRALLPRNLPQLDCADIAFFYRSATETGGDWMGFFTRIDQSLYIMIGDVTGHGTPAALVAATASATCKVLAELHQSGDLPLSPSSLMNYLNKTIYDTGHPDFLMTFFGAHLDLRTGRLLFSNAGHNFPLLVRKNGEVKHLLNSNSRLGWQRNLEFSEATVELQVGDVLCFYTDGLTENENTQNQMWGERSLVQVLRQFLRCTAQEILDAVTQAAFAHFGESGVADDVTLVVMKITAEFPEKDLGKISAP